MLLAYGLNHKTAPLALREQFSVLASDMKAHLQGCHMQPGIQEAMVLSTCNRTEWYLQTDQPERLPSWLHHQHAQSPHEIDQHTYCLQAQDAMGHVLRVASGLDSMVLGETEILGQMKKAYQVAKQAGTLGESLEHLCQYVFSKAKHIRHATQINAHPISIAFVAVNLAKRIFSQLAQSKVLLIGAGETIDLVARYLQEEQVQSLLFANRTLTHAQDLAERYHGSAISLTDIPTVLPHVDMVITATNSPLALIGKGLVERAIRARKHKPIFMVDLAIPRDIEPEVGTLNDVYLYNIDDLNEVVSDSLNKRRDAAEQAETLVQAHVQGYERSLLQRNHVHLIKSYRQQIEVTRDDLLTKAVKQLRAGAEPDEVLAQFAHALTNQLMHHPSKKIRDASINGDTALLSAATELFDL